MNEACPLLRAGTVLTFLAAAAACGDVTTDLPAELSAPIPVTHRVPVPSGPTPHPIVVPEPLPVACPASGPTDVIDYDRGLGSISGTVVTAPPLAGCTANGAVCEYGDSPDRDCNAVFECSDTGATWRELRRNRCFRDLCPKNPFANIQGTPCEIPGSTSVDDEALCNINGSVCVCTTGRGGVDTHVRRWTCADVVGSGCPAVRPNIGARCGNDTYCDYAACRSKRGVAMQCHLGVWRVATPRCAP